MIPSAMSLAFASARGPPTAMISGVSIGRFAITPSGLISLHAAPSTIASSPRNSARSATTYSRSDFKLIAGLPNIARPVKPLPIATASRPGAWASIEPIAAAVATTWRRLGTSTAVPTPIRSVRSSVRAIATHTSP
jgi:hypothetical protein